MKIIPAILVQSEAEFKKQVEKLSPYFSHFQIDIGDGKFVENKTLQVENIHESGYENLSFDFDLMVENIEEELEKIGNLAKNLTVKTVLIRASKISDYQKLVKGYSQFSIGLVLDPQDSVETILHLENWQNTPSIQILTVIPGAQGQEFLQDPLKKIEQLRKADYRKEIYLDGGINDKTIPVILSKKFKPGTLCIGSFLSRAENIQDRIQILKNLTGRVM